MLQCITENPAAEKGCITVGWKMVLELRTDTETKVFQSNSKKMLLLGCDGSAR